MWIYEQGRLLTQEESFRWPLSKSLEVTTAININEWLKEVSDAVLGCVIELSSHDKSQDAEDVIDNEQDLILCVTKL